MKFFRVRNFEKYQHYKDRRPPWIKLYRDILDDPRFFRLSETDRFFLMGIFILASQHDNQLPADQAWLKVKLLTKRTVPIDVLIASEWLEWMEQSASTVASSNASKSASTNASKALALARSRETETETETEIQRQKAETKAEKPALFQNTQTLKVSRPIEAENGRADETDSIKGLQQSYALIEAHLRRNVEEMSYAGFYEGIRPLRATSHEVYLAVPGTLIQRNEGPELTAKLLTPTFNTVNKNFLRGRILRIVNLDELEEQRA